jgi:hypothetical protein
LATSGGHEFRGRMTEAPGWRLRSMARRGAGGTRCRRSALHRRAGIRAWLGSGLRPSGNMRGDGPRDRVGRWEARPAPARAPTAAAQPHLHWHLRPACRPGGSGRHVTARSDTWPPGIRPTRGCSAARPPKVRPSEFRSWPRLPGARSSTSRCPPFGRGSAGTGAACPRAGSQRAGRPVPMHRSRRGSSTRSDRRCGR